MRLCKAEDNEENGRPNEISFHETGGKREQCEGGNGVSAGFLRSTHAPKNMWAYSAGKGRGPGQLIGLHSDASAYCLLKKVGSDGKGK